MAQPLKNVLLIGAGGNLSPFILRALASDPTFNLTILTRKDGSGVSGSPNAKTVALPSPYSSSDLAPILKGQDAVINMIQPADMAQHKTVIDECVKQGVKRYVPPDFGTRSDVDKVVELVPVIVAKKDVRMYLQSKESEGLTWTTVVNGGFFDWAISSGFFGFDLANRKARLYDDGTHKSDWSLRSDVAKAIIGILKHPEETKNRYVFINSFFTDQRSVLSVVEKSLGKFTVENVDAESANREGSAKVVKGDYSGVTDSLMGVMAGGKDWALSYGRDNELLLGRGTRGEAEMEEIVGKVLKGEEVE